MSITLKILESRLTLYKKSKTGVERRSSIFHLAAGRIPEGEQPNFFQIHMILIKSDDLIKIKTSYF